MSGLPLIVLQNYFACYASEVEAVAAKAARLDAFVAVPLAPRRSSTDQRARLRLGSYGEDIELGAADDEASRALLVKIKRDLENQVRGLLKNLGRCGRHRPHHADRLV
jgi:hypothetical protein